MSGSVPNQIGGSCAIPSCNRRSTLIVIAASGARVAVCERHAGELVAKGYTRADGVDSAQLGLLA